MSIVTRFAPSPTGYLHIGSARTAIFNYLYAKHFGGKFFLRIEDTDKIRSTKEATNSLLNGLEWLRIDYDGEIIFQSQREARHVEVANELLAKGKAYKCFATQEEIEIERKNTIKDGKSFLFQSKWRNLPESYHNKDMKYVVRLKAPRDGKTIIHDQVQGEVVVSNDVLDDMVLLRGDGSPTYMLAVVVDDHDMGVTHIIRGDDHLNNGFRQKLLYEAAGWDAPIMAHIPLIHGPDGDKLSKRHGALGVDVYRDMGYISDALFNYLLHLGWSFGDKEIISRDDAIRLFDGTHIGKAPSRIDFNKMKFINAKYLRLFSNKDLILIIEEEWKKENIEMDKVTLSSLDKAVGEIKIRSELTKDLAELAKIYHSKDIYDFSSEAKEIIASTDVAIFESVADMIQSIDDITKENIQSSFKDLAEQLHMKLGQLMNPIRAIITGKTASPSIFEMIEILGKDAIVARLARYREV